MTRFERWFVARVFAREVVQDYHHDIRIEALYKMVADACIHEFSEDNAPTMNAFLRERFERSLSEITNG